MNAIATREQQNPLLLIPQSLEQLDHIAKLIIGAAPHVERSKAHLFDSEQAAINAAAILNGAGRGNYISERAQ